jgi:hypothetical protein
VSVTLTSDLYNYRAYLETLLTYGIDASRTHLTNAYWYLEVKSGHVILQKQKRKTAFLSSDGSDARNPKGFK